ncbi:MAG: hypothetical protein ACHBNF_04930 [Chromatiales bacterium]
MPSPQYREALEKAWADMEPWIQDEFPTLVRNSAPPDRHLNYKVKLEDITLDLRDLRITRFEGVRIGAAEVGDDSGGRFNINFDVLEMHGNYHMHTEPIRVLMSRTPRFAYDFDEAINLSASAGKLCYHAQLGPPLTPGGISVSPNPPIKKQRNAPRLEGVLGDFFVDAGFAQTVIAILNKKILG